VDQRGGFLPHACPSSSFASRLTTPTTLHTLYTHRHRFNKQARGELHGLDCLLRSRINQYFEPPSFDCLNSAGYAKAL